MYKSGIDGINEIRDESDREGLRIVVELRKDANHEYIRNFLLKYGGLQATHITLIWFALLIKTSFNGIIGYFRYIY